jgi:hypothetical protein
MPDDKRPGRSPRELKFYGLLGALEQQARNDMREVSRPGREAAFARIVESVDPQRELSEDERMRRAKAKQRAEMLRLALKSAKARRSKANGK